MLNKKVAVLGLSLVLCSFASSSVSAYKEMGVAAEVEGETRNALHKAFNSEGATRILDPLNITVLRYPKSAYHVPLEHFSSREDFGASAPEYLGKLVKRFCGPIQRSGPYTGQCIPQLWCELAPGRSVHLDWWTKACADTVPLEIAGMPIRKATIVMKVDMPACLRDWKSRVVSGSPDVRGRSWITEQDLKQAEEGQPLMGPYRVRYPEEVLYITLARLEKKQAGQNLCSTSEEWKALRTACRTMFAPVLSVPITLRSCVVTARVEGRVEYLEGSRQPIR